MYCQQKVINYPSFLSSTWLSTASVHLIGVSKGKGFPAQTFQGFTTLTLQIPEPVDPLFCLRTLYPNERVVGNFYLNVLTSQYPQVSQCIREVPANLTRQSFAPYFIITSGLVIPTSPCSDNFLKKEKNLAYPLGIVPGLTLGIYPTYLSLQKSNNWSNHQSLQKMTSQWKPDILFISYKIGMVSFRCPSNPLSLPPSASKITIFFVLLFPIQNNKFTKLEEYLTLKQTFFNTDPLLLPNEPTNLYALNIKNTINYETTQHINKNTQQIEYENKNTVNKQMFIIL